MDSNLTPTVHTRALQRAAERLGGKDALARYLGVTPIKLGIWMRQSIVPPGDVFLRVVDLLLEDDIKIMLHEKSDSGQRDTEEATRA